MEKHKIDIKKSGYFSNKQSYLDNLDTTKSFRMVKEILIEGEREKVIKQKLALVLPHKPGNLFQKKLFIVASIVINHNLNF